MRHRWNAVLKKSCYFSLILAIVAAALSAWTYQQQNCCGMSDFWSDLWLAMGMICAGWTTAVVVLVKQGRVV